MSLHTAFESKLEDGRTYQDEFAINLDSVSIRYRVLSERYGSFKEYMIQRVRGRVQHRDFWALRDVTLNIISGEVFGIIGVNGAGKSTLLKVVSRVLHPTEGRVIVRGSVAPLLELGAAFHHELTGRENVFLNAALLGHTQLEVEEQFEAITDFADIGQFIHSPMRTYSTGMVARLGFAVATAWEPDILVLDEVLAVGDEAFQAKCHERINSFRDNGATVLMVSHNTHTIRSICQRAAWIDEGEIQVVGDPEDVVRKYHGEG